MRVCIVQDYFRLLKSISDKTGLMQRDDVTQWTPNGRHNQRIKNLVMFGGAVTIALSLAWGSYFVFKGNLLLVTLNAMSLSAGIVYILMALKNQVRSAVIIMTHVFMVMVSLSCLGDVPVEGIPRSAHLNILPLAASTMLFFLNERLYLRIILPAISLLIFMAFSLNLIPNPSPDLLPPAEGRGIAVWINNFTGVAGTACVIAMTRLNLNVRSYLEHEMRYAIARGDYNLHYQPQVDANGTIIGAEALLRWRHPTRGNIPPGEFIPLAEETGLIIPIGEWVLRTACAQLAEWAKSPKTAGLSISVNVSATQFRQPDFLQQVRRIVMLSGADPSLLKLELTESAVADDIDVVVGKMQALKDMGITWSLDDFGTGYSSLSSLKQLPLDQLKIDQSFIRDMLTDERSMAIVNTVIQLGQTLGLEVIAEGVETKKQCNALHQAGCHSYQGYLFNPALPAKDLNEILERTPTNPSRSKPGLHVA